jgi:hypothetical protein
MSNQLNIKTINPVWRTRPTVVPVDSNYVALDSDSYIFISSTDASANTITLPTVSSIHQITVRMTARVAGTYTMSVSGGVITFALANQLATVISDPTVAGSWQVVSLFGATFA